MSTEISVYTPPATEIGDPLWDPAAFSHGFRISEMLALSGTLPKHLTGRDKIPAVHALVATAKSLGESAILLAQSSYEVGGKLGTGVPYLLSRAHRMGLDPDWTEVRGAAPVKVMVRRNGEDVAQIVEDLSVTCTCEVRGKVRSVTLTLADATRRGWTKNDQYRHSPGLMLRYRTVSELFSLYAPAVKLGLMADEADTDDTAPAPAVQVVAPVATPAKRSTVDVIDAIVVEPAPLVEPVKPVVAPDPAPAPKPALANPVTDAEAVRAWAPIGSSTTKQCADALKSAMGLQKLHGLRLKAALEHGASEGWWTTYGDLATGGIEVAAPESVAEPTPADEADEMLDEDVIRLVDELRTEGDLDLVSDAIAAAGIADLERATLAEKRRFLRECDRISAAVAP